MDATKQIVVGDVGGTHARFAIADLGDGAPRLSPIRKYRTAEHDGLAGAWQAFAAENGYALPEEAAIAIAVAIEGEILKFPNSGWEIDRRTIAATLGLERLLLLNDFGAVAHAVSVLTPEKFVRLAGPAEPATNGVTTVIGPGTGLGIAILVERDGAANVIETEGGHVAFAPRDEQERAVEAEVRRLHGRCSLERIVSGPGLKQLYQLLGGRDNEDAALWAAALAGDDPIAVRALDMLVGVLGSAAGDLSLAHGSMRVVITGGLANRMEQRLAQGDFAERFAAKGRYSGRQQRVSIWLAREEEPGLLGAAVAFQRAGDR